MKLDQTRWQEAKKLAARPYQLHFFPDESTVGETGYYVRVPEMPGCVSDGATVEEARNNIQDALVDFIYFLLEDGMEVPEPMPVGSRAVMYSHEPVPSAFLVENDTVRATA